MMLAAQMQESADQALAPVSVIVMAARPVAVVGKMLEHQVEQLHRLCDFLFRHGLTAAVVPAREQHTARTAALIGTTARPLLLPKSHA